MNVYASRDAVLITAEVPGIAQEDLDLTVRRDTVTLRGERKDTDDQASGFHRRERGRGRFVRALSLPFPVDPDQVEANMADGVLRLKLHRPESDQPKRIQIKAN